jgi:hypothetical protein
LKNDLGTAIGFPSLSMNALTLEQEALKLSPLGRVRLADLLYASLETDAKKAWNRLALTECDARFEAYKNGEMKTVDANEALEMLWIKYGR